MARTKQFDENQAVDAVMRKFWENGFDGTSMHDLEQCTELNRTSLYNAFGNKRALFERALSRYNERVLGELFALLVSAPTVRQGISELLHTVLENQFDKNNPGGCMMALTVLESAQHDEQTIEKMKQTMHGLKRELQSRLNHAKKSGELSKALDASGVAATITTTIAGMAVMSKAGFTKSVVKKAINQVIKLLD